MPERAPAADVGGDEPGHLQLVGWADDELPEDDRLDRLLGDRDLLLRLQLSGYADAAWQPVATEFARYGLGILRGWLYTGAIFGQVYAKTRNRLRPPDGPLCEDARETLATDTVIAALRVFRERILKQNRWDPARGASLKTFFIGQCCFQFANAYRKWERAERRWNLSSSEVARDYAERDRTGTPGVDEQVIRRAAAADALRSLSTETARAALRLTALGYSQAEIAEQLEVADAKSVENLLNYQRRRLAQRQGQERSG